MQLFDWLLHFYGGGRPRESFCVSGSQTLAGGAAGAVTLSGVTSAATLAAVAGAATAAAGVNSSEGEVGGVDNNQAGCD